MNCEIPRIEAGQNKNVIYKHSRLYSFYYPIFPCGYGPYANFIFNCLLVAMIYCIPFQVYFKLFLKKKLSCLTIYYLDKLCYISINEYVI